MKKYLIKSAQGTSEWLTEFDKVQTFMNRLEKEGVMNATVQLFEDKFLRCTIKYSWNGENWQIVDQLVKTLDRKYYR